jgi:hypothetical protein
MSQGRFLPLTTTTDSTGSSFLNPNDITDAIAQDFIEANDPRVPTWMDEVDGKLLSLALQLDVPLTSISMPLHCNIWEYAKACFCFQCFRDTANRANVTQGSQDNEIAKSRDWYRDECSRLRNNITQEMFMYTNLSLIASQSASPMVSLIRA